MLNRDGIGIRFKRDAFHLMTQIDQTSLCPSWYQMNNKDRTTLVSLNGRHSRCVKKRQVKIGRHVKFVRE